MVDGERTSELGMRSGFVVLLDGRWQGVCCLAPGLRLRLASKPLEFC